MDSISDFVGHQNPLNVGGGHSCINMMSAENVVMRAKYYGSSQPNVGKEPTPPKVPLHIDKPEVIPHIPKGVLKCLGHNPNSHVIHHYYIVKDLG